jgi:hypothetical protein
MLEDSVRTRQKETETTLIQKEKDLILAYDDQIYKARTELDGSYRAREEALELKYLELEKKLTSDWVAKETAWNIQKTELVEREIAQLRSSFGQKEAALETRVKDLEKSLGERKNKLEEEFDRKSREMLMALATDRDQTRSTAERRAKEIEDSYREKMGLLDAERAKVNATLMQREEELSSRQQKLERDLRNEAAMTKIEQASAYDEKVRKLAEERTQLQKDYERRIRELEARYRQGGGPKATD